MVDGWRGNGAVPFGDRFLGYSSFFFLYFFRLLFGRKGKNAYLCTVRDK